VNVRPPVVRRRAVDVAVFTLVLVAGYTRLPEPFFADQTVNLLMGQVIARGGAPYVDLWDPSYPGTFLFFAAAGEAFGYTEISIHVFELLWMLLFAMAVRVAAGWYLEHHVAASLAPLIGVGTYYAGTTSYHLTQTEAIVGLPLLVSLAAAAYSLSSECRRPVRWLFASGVSGGIVAVFHGPYVGIPMVFWLLVVLEGRRRGIALCTAIRRIVPVVTAGAMLPVLLVLAYLLLRTGWHTVLWTLVIYPMQAIRECPISSQRLLDSTAWFVKTFRVPLVLCAFGAWDTLRRHPWQFSTVALLAWILVGTLLIVADVLSWWAYQYLLLLAPVAVLSVQGIKRLCLIVSDRATRGWFRAVTFGLLSLLAVQYGRQLQPVGGELSRSFRERLPLDEETLRAYQADRYPSYREDAAAVAFLNSEEAHQGAIYVFAMPNLYHVARRSPAIPLLAAWFRPTVALWNRLIAELEAAAPPYILINDHELEFVIYQNPALMNQVRALRPRLERRYSLLTTSTRGTWYVRMDLRVPPRTSPLRIRADGAAALDREPE
jgi:hypothetical protein